MKKTGTKKEKSPLEMAVLRPHAAGVDLGSTRHYACAPDAAKPQEPPEVRGFGTTTAQLLELIAWFKACGIKSVAMESTSVYWIALYELLEEAGIEPVLVNARQLHKVPGRKTDVQDCQWIQRLHACGLLRGSFRPAGAICALRTLSRQCAQLVEERNKAVSWMQKSLDQMNVQVHRAVTDLTGATGLAIVRAIVAGQRDPLQLAQLRDRRCRKSLAQIAEHLQGSWKPEHLFNLEETLALFDFLEGRINHYHQSLQQQLQALAPEERRDHPAPAHPSRAKAKASQRKQDEPLRGALWRLSGVDLTTINGIGVGMAQVILTEVGPNLGGLPDRERLRLLAPSLSPHGYLRGQAAAEKTQRLRRQSYRRPAPCRGTGFG